MTPLSTARRDPRMEWVTAATVVALGVLIVALIVGGGGTGTVLLGLDDPGPGTRWGLPVARLIFDASAAITIGLLLLAVILPASSGKLERGALRALWAAARTAVVWAAAAVVVHLLTLSDLLGLPLTEALAGNSFVSYTASIVQGQAYAATVVLVLAIVPAARLTLFHGGAVALLCLGIGALIPPALAGHASSGDYHHSAVISLMVHLVAIALWVGGLAALLWYGGKGQHSRQAAMTYSAVAFGCFLMVGASGVLNGWVRLASVGELVTSTYGLLLLGKAAAFVALGWFGYLHRQRTLPALEAGRPGAFKALAAQEITIMAAAIGLAVGLGRTPPPVPESLGTISRARELLEFPIPPEPTLWRLVSQTYPEALFGTFALLAAVLYLVGVAKLRNRGDHWPLGRTVAWLAGVATIAFATMSGLMTYGMTMLSVHMVQHLVLMMVSPLLLVLGGPLTLALRAVPAAGKGRQGPREWLLAGLHSNVARLLTHPLVALALFASGPFLVYFTGLFEAAMRDHTGHLLMSMHFLLTGYLFYEVIIGLDPLPRRPPYLARVGLQFGAMVFHAIFGLALVGSARLIAGDYYQELAADIPWLPGTLADQRMAGEITWGVGELPGLVVIAVLFVQWYRSDQREAHRFDRREGSAEAEREAYNAYLASLHARAQPEDRDRQVR